jgi:hypothetical protein
LKIYAAQGETTYYKNVMDIDFTGLSVGNPIYYAWPKEYATTVYECPYNMLTKDNSYEIYEAYIVKGLGIAAPRGGGHYTVDSDSWHN